MEVFLPTLEENMRALVSAFRFVVFAIMVVGLIAQIAHRSSHGVGVIAPLVRAVMIVVAIAYLDRWYPRVEQGFLFVATFIDTNYAENPTAAADVVRESTTQNPEGQEWSWRRMNESIYQAVTNAFATVFVYVGTLLTVPMLILQYVLRWLLYMIAPFALAVFMVPGLSSIGVRFVQQVLAVLAWPVGFAITNVVALAVWYDFRAAVVPNPETVEDAIFSPTITFFGALLATIIIVVGMVSTPIVMQMLFAQGSAFTGNSANPGSIMRTVTHGMWLMQGGRGLTNRPMPDATSTTASASPPPAPMGSAGRPGI
jgi:hypothetical protein